MGGGWGVGAMGKCLVSGGGSPHPPVGKTLLLVWMESNKGVEAEQC